MGQLFLSWTSQQSLSGGRTTCSQEAATVAVRQAPAARAGNQAILHYRLASGAGSCRTYNSDKQLSVGETVNFLREPDAGHPPVRFDEREQETELSQTGLRRRRESFVRSHRETKATAPVLDSTPACLRFKSCLFCFRNTIWVVVFSQECAVKVPLW